ncbi:MAG: 16S rRNA (uracil(1498)-N(3))-methyltransferase [Gammaproteobacteria bacterium]|jgi:16S rRNA (uracil1498-N3)-methyltransferase|nr:16S rRNA (uracil(1498)-N(3))-methyltransferase [Gammaproteobacteria bacterium]
MNRISDAPMFYCPQPLVVGQEIRLDDDEFHHLASVRRCRAGDLVLLFDGRGCVASARLREDPRRSGNLPLAIEKVEQRPLPGPELELVCALPKRDRQPVLVGMAVQLGVHRITPLDCARSVARFDVGSRDRWQRLAVEACKQSRRALLPSLAAPESVLDAAGRLRESHATGLIAHPGGAAPSSAGHLRGAVVAYVGPEGGFVEEEVVALEAAGAQRIGLGQGILRTETAAAALLGYVVLRRL